MKKISHISMIVALMLASTQISKGQASLGFGTADSTLIDSSYYRTNFDGPILIEPIKVPHGQEHLYRNRKEPIDTSSTGTRGLYYTNLHPHIPNQFSIDSSKTVGEIPIQHHVAPNSATTYTVPIECPPGRAGVQPTITLSYNSLSGNSVLGFGWSIGGLSSIYRTPSNYYYDGEVKPIEMTASAKFNMDGTRLIQTQFTSTVRTFKSEFGNIKIEAFMNGAITNYFKVWFSNGSTAIYGYDTNTTTNELNYPLTLMTDMLGNQIKYTYEKVNNHYYIKEIKYGSSKTITNDFASVKFFYKTRTDVSSGWEEGIEITENRLLDYIQCINNSTIIRTYNFTYNLNKVNLLTQIDCNLSSGSLNPLKFYYGTNNQLPQFENVNSSALLYFNNIDLIVRSGKFDLWGDDDAVIAYPNKCPYLEITEKTIFGIVIDRYYVSEYANDQKLLVYPLLSTDSIFPEQFISGAGFMELTSGDIDGVPGDELIKITNGYLGQTEYLNFSIYKPNGYGGYYTYKTKEYPLGAVLQPKNGVKSVTPKVYVVGDFTGMGKMQVLAVSRYKPLETNFPTRIMLFDLDAPQNTPLCDLTVSGFNFKANNSSSDIIYAIDYNGDGRMEICHIHETGTDIYAFSGTNSLSLSKVTNASISNLTRDMATSRNLMVGDINGDGKTDLLLPPDVGSDVWTIYYAKGDGGFSINTQSLISHYKNSKYILRDINNDGKADIIQFGTGLIFVYPYVGNGFSLSYEVFANFSFSSNAKMIPAVIGNGISRTFLFSLDNQKIDKITFKMDHTRQRMMSGAVNSLGVVTKSEYKQLDDKSYPSIYSKGSGASFPFQNFNDPLWATAETQTWYNNVQQASNSYYYTNAIVHRQGLGFRGFTNFSVNDNRYRTVTQTFNPKNHGVLKKVVSPIYRVEYLYNVPAGAFKGTDSIRIAQQKETNLLNNNVITTNYQSYDSYNQPLSVETEYGTGSGVKTKREYVYSNTNITTAYVLGLPVEEKITNTRSGSSWINKTNITYSNYLPITKTTCTGTSGTLQTGYETFGYDTEGNLTKHSFKPYSSADTLTTLYTYDTSKKRFLKTETNTMGRVTTYDIYDNFGRLTSLKDYTNQTTTFDYDILDRQTSITTPDGVTSMTEFAWNRSNNGSVMSITAITTGRPNSVKYVNAFGRTTRESTVGFSGSNIFTDYEYDQYGRLYRTTDPYTSTKRYTTYEYDGYDRLWKQTTPAGRQTVTTYSGNTVTTVDEGMTTTKTFDVSGALLQASDPACTITYYLRPDGQPSSIKTLNNVTTSFEYDTYGRQQSVTDPSAGLIQFQYNAEGLLWKKINARNQTTTYTYNNFGQVLTEATPEQTITYTYDPTYKWLTNVTAGAHYGITYLYDAFGRIKKKTEVEGTVSMIMDYTYDSGRVKTVKYNNVASDVLTYNYNTYGYLKNIQFDSTTIYTLNSRDDMGQLTNYTFGNNVVTSRDYSNYGSPLTIKTSKSDTDLVNFSYNFDDIQGTLTSRSRTDIAGTSGQENFTYDNLQRLKNYGKSSLTYTVNYSAMGNITSKTDAGSFQYTYPSRPYRITELTNFPATYDTDMLTVIYTSGERPLTINKQSNSAIFQYNHAGERTKMTVNGTNGYTRTYLGGNYEHEKNGSTTIERLYLGGTPYNAPAVAIRTNSDVWKLHYIHRDHLGSIVAVSNASGAVETRSYDAWGRLRDPSTLQPFAYNAQPTLLLRRGYTGHEHLPEFGLINMNARMYDPVLGRFLSPDPYVADGAFSQDFNRYAYCLNNPLIYTDPDGEWGWIAAGLGFVYGYVSYGLMNGDWGWKAAANGGLTGLMWGIGYTSKVKMSEWAFSANTALSSIANSFMPSYNKQIGDGFSVSISPNIMFGTHTSLGANFGLNYADENVAFGAGMSTNYTSNGWGFKNSGFNIGSYGYGAVNFGDGYTVSLSRSHFRGSDNQITSMLGLRHKEWSFYYENDFPLGDGHDRWRTAAVSINYKGEYGDHGIGVNIYTEQAGYFAGDKNRRMTHMLASGRIGYGASGIEAALYYRNGANYYGLSHHKIGHFAQNILAHDIGTGGSTKHFLWGRDGYGGGMCYDGLFWLYKSPNIYTLW